jgi:iron-sulfur cluster repair protein YtfE (RIC family)
VRCRADSTRTAPSPAPDIVDREVRNFPTERGDRVTDEMMTAADAIPFLRAHECFRRDVARIRALAVSGGPKSDAGQIALRGYWHDLAVVLEHHHDNEDRVIFPRLTATLPEAAEAIQALGAEHTKLDEVVAAVTVAVDPGKGTGSARGLADAARELETIVTAHLDAEERDVVPLFSRCFSRAEWAELEAANTRELSRRGLFPFVLPWILEGMEPELVEPALDAFGARARADYHARWLGAYLHRCAALWPVERGRE